MIYNVNGSNHLDGESDVLSLTPEFFEASWRHQCFGSFLWAKAFGPAMVQLFADFDTNEELLDIALGVLSRFCLLLSPHAHSYVTHSHSRTSHTLSPSQVARGSGSLLFTGATASIKGFAEGAHVAVPKFGTRALAQSLARELHPKVGLGVDFFCILTWMILISMMIFDYYSCHQTPLFFFRYCTHSPTHSSRSFTHSPPLSIRSLTRSLPRFLLRACTSRT